jgi:hypothetical protein
LLLEPHPHRPVAALGDVLIHALRCLPFRESLVMVDCAVGRGDMTLDFLRQGLPGRRNGRAREVLEWVERGSESLLETPRQDVFPPGRDPGGDAGPQWAQVKKDQRRNNRSVVQGYSVLRHYYDDVVPAAPAAQ